MLSRSSDLLGTHPPIKKRLDKLLALAQSNLSVKTTGPAEGFFIKEGAEWSGPHTMQHILSMGLALPVTWMTDGRQLFRANEDISLVRAFDSHLQHASPGKCPRCQVALEEGAPEGGGETLRCTHCKGVLLARGALEQMLRPPKEGFGVADVDEARQWRLLQKGGVQELCHFPITRCPRCSSPMEKFVYSELTKVVLDRCSSKICRSVWCDANEINRIRILINTAVR